jgi:hypothetical protein
LEEKSQLINIKTEEPAAMPVEKEEFKMEFSSFLNGL